MSNISTDSGTGGGDLNFPTAITALDAHTLLVVDALNFRVQRLDRWGKPLAVLGRLGDTSGSMANYAWPLMLRKMQEVLDAYPTVKGWQVMSDEGTYMFSSYRGRWLPDTPMQRKLVLERMRDWFPFSNSSPVEGIVEAIRTPLRNPDYAPFLQRAKDAKPDALFVFVPSGEGLAVMKQFDERGLKQAGIRLIATGDVTDDDQLNDMGDVALGVVNSHHYSAAHNSAANKKFVKGFRALHFIGPCVTCLLMLERIMLAVSFAAFP